MRSLVSIALLAQLAGCALTIDGIYKLSGPHARPAFEGAERATGRIEATREISFDGAGLVCTDVALPWVKAPKIEQQFEHPNGYKAATQVFTVAEVAALGIAAGVHEHGCATDGCDNHASWYAYLIPLMVDIAWGTYRSFTIHDAILRRSEVTWNGAERPGEALHAVRVPCEVGTEVPLYAGGEQLLLEVGAEGRVSLADVPALGVFVAAHAGISVGGANIALDASGIADLVRTVRAAQPPGSAPAISVPPVRVPSGATIDVGGAVEVDVRVHRR